LPNAAVIRYAERCPLPADGLLIWNMKKTLPYRFEMRHLFEMRQPSKAYINYAAASKRDSMGRQLMLGARIAEVK
jgi:hypothetical protein